MDQHADVYGEAEEHTADWGGPNEGNHTYSTQRVQLRGQNRSRQATDSGTYVATLTITYYNDITF